jgi:calmodulin
MEVASKEECQEAFYLYDTNADGKIEIDQLGTLLRACGKAPTNAEVENYKKEVGSDSFDFETFYKIFEKAKSYSRDEIIKCFQIFDRENTGKVYKAHLIKVLTNVGEKLKQEEVNKILQDVPVDDNGYIDYKQFVDMKLMPKKN